MKLTLSIIIFLLITIIVLMGGRHDKVARQLEVSKKIVKGLEAERSRLKADSSMLSKYIQLYDFKLMEDIKKQGL